MLLSIKRNKSKMWPSRESLLEDLLMNNAKELVHLKIIIGG